jgi:Flp pilus assembly pilin Flp
MSSFRAFSEEESGAATIEWVAVAAGLLLLGITVLYAIHNNGVSQLVLDVNATLNHSGTAIALPTADRMGA